MFRTNRNATNPTAKSKPEWRSEQIELTSDRGANIVLHKVSPDTESVHIKAPVLLAHGTFSNHRTCAGLARYLASKGYTCWLIDFEGHGNSQEAHPGLNFENMFLSGSKAALQYVYEVSGENVHWVGHSGGGLAALMLLARQPDLCKQLQSLTLLGSQACEAGKPLSRKICLWSATVLSHLLREVPGKAMGLGPENETTDVMLQWYQWNLKGQWQGSDGFNYTRALQRLTPLGKVPVFGLAGSGDHYIAPPLACQNLHAILPVQYKRWQECGLNSGFEEDYSHARLVSSRAAAREIWPQVEHWLTSSS